MASRPVELDERIGNWKRAYDHVLPELVTDAQRDLLKEVSLSDIPELGAYVSLARNVMAGQRAAAIVAAMLVTSGIRPLPLAETDEQA